MTATTTFASPKDAYVALCEQVKGRSPKTDDVERMVRFFDQFDSEQAVAAIEWFMAHPIVIKGKTCLPFREEFADRLQAKGGSTPQAASPWYLPDGMFGGPWDGAKKTAFLAAAAVMVGSICHGFDPHKERRSEFIALACDNGVSLYEINRIGEVFRRSGPTALNDEIAELVRAGAL